ncbi:hypothetical protein NHQ30_001402 [Ciborinia camelliae]|nr:hypothetical protein NHQ30_001402 [Ciborinia camelliae]
MRLSFLIPVFFILTYTSQALTYWLHESCSPGKPLQAPNNIATDGIKRWEVFFDELRAGGKTAGDRLANSNRDPDFTRAFNVLFRQDNANKNIEID